MVLLVLESWFTYQNVRNVNIYIGCNWTFSQKVTRKKIITKKPVFWTKTVIFIIFLLFIPSNGLTLIQ